MGRKKHLRNATLYFVYLFHVAPLYVWCYIFVESSHYFQHCNLDLFICSFQTTKLMETLLPPHDQPHNLQILRPQQTLLDYQKLDTKSLY